MDRRTFITRGPFAMTALAGGRVAAEEDSPKRRRILGLLDKAEHWHAQVHDLIHTPWECHRARPMLALCIDAAAEAWLRDRGLECRSRRSDSWLFDAMNRPDAITGIGWRAAHLALCGLARDCDPLFDLDRCRNLTAAARGALLAQARDTMLVALDAAARLIEGVRSEVVHRVPAATAGMPGAGTDGTGASRRPFRSRQ